MKQFKLDMNADTNFSSLQGYVKLRYSDIVAAFGRGADYGDKTTQEWSFVSDDGKVFTLYDWKTETTPQYEYEWHVGGHSDATEFIQWLEFTVRNNGTIENLKRIGG